MKHAVQLPLDLPVRPALGREDFVLSSANEVAVAALDADHSWPQGKAVLTGPEASGKTHLVHVWASHVEAAIVAASELPRLDLPMLAAAGRVVVEDVPQICGDRAAETALFHLHNLIVADSGRLLMTGRGAAAQWRLRLPDLASRVVATQMVALEAPDDALLKALLIKHFRDRQLQVPPAVIAYLLSRMNRSGSAARSLVAAMDVASLARQQPITVPLARRILQQRGMADETAVTEDIE